ncbi:hypothetical protein AMATHDRAFT_140079 [Amanita thiersii Skay4041]|uniref:Ribosomal protein S2 n=1 Tax=Amanita thiersii Skay4041 TaxID=703135 RepID=A0A2A9NXC9_9AGAR|nr:hypothetical protein AMATHDRAFT_140079 [Amanita thiersii Skay4041]
MSLGHSFRPWLASSLRCSLHPQICARSAPLRFMSTEGATEALGGMEVEALETSQDWHDFQIHRAQRSALVDVFSQYGSTHAPGSTFRARDTLRKPATHPTISALLAAGAHFGHATSRMNPNFMPYAYGTRAGITVIDLDQTLPLLRRAVSLVRSIAYAKGTIVFVGTRPDLRPVVQTAAERFGGYYVGDRWLPGTLTNKIQLFGADTVKEQKFTPDLVILLNPLENMHAIRECAIEHVPTIGIVDSNADPRIVMYPIPANDESTRTAELIAGVLSIAGKEGTTLRAAEDKKAEADAERAKQTRRPRY